MSFCAYFLLILGILLTIDQKNNLDFPLCLASVNLIFLTINYSLECTFTVSIYKPPYSPLPAMLSSWHWVAKQYFPYTE